MWYSGKLNLCTCICLTVRLRHVKHDKAIKQYKLELGAVQCSYQMKESERRSDEDERKGV